MPVLVYLLAALWAFLLSPMEKSGVVPALDISAWNADDRKSTQFSWNALFAVQERTEQSCANLFAAIEAEDFFVLNNEKQLRFENAWEHDFLKAMNVLAKKGSIVTRVSCLAYDAIVHSGRTPSLKIFDIAVPGSDTDIDFSGIALQMNIDDSLLRLQRLTGKKYCPQYNTLQKSEAQSLLEKINSEQEGRSGFSAFWCRPFVRNLSIGAAFCAGAFCLFRAKPGWFASLSRFSYFFSR